jgi:shikimate dehydrogenase
VSIRRSGIAEHDVFEPSRADVCVGLIGAGIQASLTPAMHMGEARHHGLDCEYRLIDIERLSASPSMLPELLAAAEIAGFAGVNITYPFKQAVIEELTALSEDARALNAVNTVVFAAGRRTGYNTDCWGFGEAFNRDFSGARRDVVVLLGAGGAGSAVANALLVSGTPELRIVEADAAKGYALASTLATRFPDRQVTGGWSPAAAVTDADGIVNATPVGMAKLAGMPLASELVTPRHWLIDIIYFPRETALLRHARSLGCRTANGGGMAVFQAVKAFELFTGRAADAARMTASFEELVRAAEAR